MGARHFYRYTEGDPVEEVPNVLRWAYVAGEKAEEGEAGSWEVFVDDPDMTANFVGHRRWLVYEDASDDANELLVDGIVTAVRVKHNGGDVVGPAGRVWTIEIADLNTLFTYRVMTGSDSQFAADQTDVDRVLQVANSEEMGYFDDLTFVFSGDTVEMDEYNGRGSYTGQIIDQCAQETGKNWYIYSTGTITGGADIGLWYGFDSEDAYTSPLSLSNDPADLDMPAVNAGTATTYPIGADTELRRDYGRQYSAAYGEFQDGAKYIPDTENPYDPGITLSGRDIVHPAPEIKTRSRMKRRLLRILRDHATPDEVIKTTITLPANKATQLRAGMQVAFKATHEPNYDTSRLLRIMSATPKPAGMKAGADIYEIALELQGPGIEGAAPASCSTSMANTDATTLDEAQPGSSGTISLAVTPSYPGPTVLIPVLEVSSGTPTIDAFSGSYSVLINDDNDSSRPAWQIGFKQMTAPGTGTAGASWTAYGDGGNLFIHAAIPSSSSAPVQDDYIVGGVDAAFGVAPTVGNIVVMVCIGWGTNVIVGPVPPGPTTGWTLVGGVSNTSTLPVPPYNGINRGSIAVYARCVEEGETGTYGFAVSGGFPGSKATYIAELEP